MKYLLALLLIFFVFRHGEEWTYKTVNKAPGKVIVLVQLDKVRFLWIEFSKKGLRLRELLKS